MTRVASPTYLKLVRQLPCFQCGRHSPAVMIEANHSTWNRGKGQKMGDSEAFPLCRECHIAYHKCGIRLRREIDQRAVEATRAAIALRWPNFELPPRDAPEQEIPAPVFRIGR